MARPARRRTSPRNSAATSSRRPASPTFLYDFGPVRVEDFPDAVAGKDDASIRRTITLTSTRPVANAWFRAAVADKIEPPADGWFTLAGGRKMRLSGGGKPFVRILGRQGRTAGPDRVPRAARRRIVQEIDW